MALIDNASWFSTASVSASSMLSSRICWLRRQHLLRLDSPLLPVLHDDKSPETAVVDDPARFTSHDTVGAVALDARGNLAAATSTGGTLNKTPGRVGDSSLIGCGCYADNLSAAVSLTAGANPS